MRNDASLLAPSSPPRSFIALPKGRRDLLLQLAVWAGFLAAYEIARGLADRGAEEAYRNARRVMAVEQELGGLWEVDLQEAVLPVGEPLMYAVDWTYWLSQLAVVWLCLLWIYLRRNEAYLTVRDALIATNTLALAVYVALPTAPPRFFPDAGYVDTLARYGPLHHGAGIVEVFANPYAAMPSLHAADALLIGLALAGAVRRRPLRALFLAWPGWVAFALLASANHFWLDIAAGYALSAAGAGVALAAGRRRRPSPAEERAMGG